MLNPRSVDGSTAGRKFKPGLTDSIYELKFESLQNVALVEAGMEYLSGDGVCNRYQALLEEHLY